MTDFLNEMAYEEKWSINSIHVMIERNEIDLHPEYNRKFWVQRDMKGFVVSLMNGFSCPPMSMYQDVDMSSGRKFYECDDGMNRINSIRMFLCDNMEINGKTFSDLPIKTQNNFKNIHIPVVLFLDLSAQLF